MSILNDENFLDAIAEIDSVLPRSLWAKLDDIAGYLALIGANDEAFVVWRLAYSGLLPVPEQFRDQADCLVTSFCFHGRYPDLAGEYHQSQGAGIRSLEERVRRRDLRAYQMLLMWKYATPLFFRPLAHLRAGLDKARPTGGERTSSSELEALPKFDAFIEAPGKFGHSLIDVHLIYADIAHRRGMADVALAQLRAWKQCATWLNTSLHGVLSLTSTAQLAYGGALASTSAIDPGERRATVGEMLCRWVDRIETPEDSFEYPQALEKSVFYSTLSFEPGDDERYEPEWELNLWTGAAPPVPAPGEPYPSLVALAGLSSGYSTIRIEYPSQLPEDLTTGNVVAFPLRVLPNETDGTATGRKGTLFPNSVTSAKDDVGFQTPPGEYDVLARLSAEEEQETSLYKWDVLLSLFPRGTIAQHGVLHWTSRAE